MEWNPGRVRGLLLGRGYSLARADGKEFREALPRGGGATRIRRDDEWRERESEVDRASVRSTEGGRETPRHGHTSVREGVG